MMCPHTHPSPVKPPGQAILIYSWHPALLAFAGYIYPGYAYIIVCVCVCIWLFVPLEHRCLICKDNLFSVLEECQAFSRHSISILCINKWMNEQISEFCVPEILLAPWHDLFPQYVHSTREVGFVVLGCFPLFTFLQIQFKIEQVLSMFFYKASLKHELLTSFSQF